jgi:hypothetical protein
LVERAVLAGVEIDFDAPAPSATRRSDGGWQVLAFFGAEPDEEVPFEITYRGRARAKPHVCDCTFALPASARPLLQARAKIPAAPIHTGDGVVVAAPIEGF